MHLISTKIAKNIGLLKNLLAEIMKLQCF